MLLSLIVLPLAASALSSILLVPFLQSISPTFSPSTTLVPRKRMGHVSKTELRVKVQIKTSDLLGEQNGVRIVKYSVFWMFRADAKTLSEQKHQGSLRNNMANSICQPIWFFSINY